MVPPQTDLIMDYFYIVDGWFGLGATGCWMTVIFTVPAGPDVVASCGLASRDCHAVRGRDRGKQFTMLTDTCGRPGLSL